MGDRLKIGTVGVTIYLGNPSPDNWEIGDVAVVEGLRPGSNVYRWRNLRSGETAHWYDRRFRLLEDKTND